MPEDRAAVLAYLEERRRFLTDQLNCIRGGLAEVEFAIENLSPAEDPAGLTLESAGVPSLQSTQAILDGWAGELAANGRAEPVAPE